MAHVAIQAEEVKAVTPLGQQHLCALGFREDLYYILCNVACCILFCISFAIYIYMYIPYLVQCLSPDGGGLKVGTWKQIQASLPSFPGFMGSRSGNVRLPHQGSIVTAHAFRS